MDPMSIMQLASVLGEKGEKSKGVMAMLGGGALMGLNALSSRRQQREAQRQLDALGQQAIPQYEVNPAVARLYSMANREIANPQGFMPAERAAYQANMARGLNTQFANARSMAGGSMSRALSGVLSGNQLAGYNQFAGQDAALARGQRNAAYSRLIGAANTMQGLQSQNVGTALSRRLRQEALLGQAIASQRAYRQNMWGGMGRDLFSAGVYKYMTGGQGGNDKVNPLLKRFAKFTPPSEFGDTPELPQ